MPIPSQLATTLDSLKVSFSEKRRLSSPTGISKMAEAVTHSRHKIANVILLLYQVVAEQIALDPKYHDILAIVKGARNGAVYGAKVRFPHALVYETFPLSLSPQTACCASPAPSASCSERQPCSR